VRLNVKVAVPEPPASVPVTGGTSLAGSSTALNVAHVAEEGAVTVSPPQDVASEARSNNPER
jgi:hypothetical protein